MEQFWATYPKFVGAQRYVRDGLSKDGMAYEMMTEDYDEEMIKGAVWDDTIIDTNKKGKLVLTHSFMKEFKSKEIIDAARFRYALVSDDEWEEGFGLESFYYAFDQTGFWAKEYMKHSKIIFDYLIQEKDIFGKCEGTHKIDAVRKGKTESTGFAMCETAHYEVALMRHHISNCSGDQSDKLWRIKVFLLLNDEIQKLPKEIGMKVAQTRSQETKMKWLHTVCVLLAAVDEWDDFIYNRLYDPDDFKPLVDISDRVSCTMKALIACDTFNDQQMTKVLAFLTMKMESVASTFDRRISDDFWEDKKPELFGGSRSNSTLSTCQKLVKTNAEKFLPNVHKVAVEPDTAKKTSLKSKKRTSQESDVAPQSKKTK